MDNYITRSGITEDNGGSSSSGCNGNSGMSSSVDSSSDGGINFPEFSLGGIKIPNPFDLVSKYIKLIKVMVIPSNYQK